MPLGQIPTPLLEGLAWDTLALQASVFTYKMGITAIPSSEGCCEIDDNSVSLELKKGNVRLPSWEPKGPAGLPWSHHASKARLIPWHRPVHLLSLKSHVVKTQTTLPQAGLATYFSLLTRGRLISAERSTDLEYLKRHVLTLNLGFLVESTQSFKQTPVSEPHSRPIKSQSLAGGHLASVCF